jgi:hypothetical protein
MPVTCSAKRQHLRGVGIETNLIGRQETGGFHGGDEPVRAAPLVWELERDDAQPSSSVAELSVEVDVPVHDDGLGHGGIGDQLVGEQIRLADGFVQRRPFRVGRQDRDAAVRELLCGMLNAGQVELA